ncbi:MAG TPA: alpha/beta fold hydrolase [Mycobacteriales bacterium]|nr:alpha/beta fold hydrolase [Mycobacteriales bacterium]
MRVTPVLGAAMARFAKAPRPVDLPPGRLVELPGRGRTCVTDVPGPPGAPTLVLLHALATTAALSWYPSIETLRKHYRVVTFDQRWHGRGIRCDKFRLEDCADDVVAVADALGIDRFTVVGYSMGGAVAQLVWRRHRHRVEGLVLAATARNFRGKNTERLWFGLTQVAMSRWGEAVRTRADRLHAGLPDEPTGLTADDDRVAPWALGEFRSTSAWALLAAIDEVGRFDSSAWIRRVDVPTSVVVATRDRFIPTRRQRRLAAAIPGSMVYDVTGNHAALVLGADEFVPVLLDACRSVTRRAEQRRAA